MNTILGGSQKHHPAGLGNWDNSCYQNSVIQGLASLHSFGPFIKGTLDTGEEARLPTHVALKDILDRLNATDSGPQTLWTPSALKSMNSWQQQDAQEYFSKVMDEVDRESLRSYGKHKVRPGFEAALDPAPHSNLGPCPFRNPFEGLLAQRVGCKQCGYTEGLSLLPFNCLTVNIGPQYEYDVRDLLEEHTGLEDIEGVECVKCTLLRVQTQLEALAAKSTISEPSAGSDQPSKLQAAVGSRLETIRKVFADDSFSEPGLLKRCNVPAKSQVMSVKSKQVIIARPPKSLVIHINRSIFDDFGTQRKNTAAVRFPRRLDLSRWCLGSKLSPAGVENLETWPAKSTESMLPACRAEYQELNKLYELRCVVTHYGRHENGHYVAYGKRRINLTDSSPDATKESSAGERWYCFNDEVVTEVSEEDVLDRGGVFMLFYEALPPQQSLQTLPELEIPTQVEKRYSEATSGSYRAADEVVNTSDVEEMVGALREPQDAMPESREKDHALPQENASCDPADRNEAQSLPTKVSSSPESPLRASSLTPLMRTSSASPSKSRNSRRPSNFTMHSPSVISAV